jgi:hypothetical protein
MVDLSLHDTSIIDHLKRSITNLFYTSFPTAIGAHHFSPNHYSTRCSAIVQQPTALSSVAPHVFIRKHVLIR